MTKRGKIMIIVAALLMSGASFAADRQWTVSGTLLKIDTPCAKTVTILPSPALKGQMELVATASHQEEIDLLRFTGGKSVILDKTGPRCWSSNAPSLSLTLRVPLNTPIDIAERGSSDYRLGDIGGPLQLALAGSGTVIAGHSAALSIASTGSGDVEVAVIDGAVQAKLSGSGNLSLGQVLSSSTDASATGLQFISSGSGDIQIRQASASLQARLSGSGNLTVTTITTPTVDLRTTGSSSIHIAQGSIDDLSIAASGSSDIEVAAQVRNASLNITGSSDINLPSVSGHVAQNQSGSGHIQIGKR